MAQGNSKKTVSKQSENSQKTVRKTVRKQSENRQKTVRKQEANSQKTVRKTVRKREENRKKTVVVSSHTLIDREHRSYDSRKRRKSSLLSMDPEKVASNEEEIQSRVG